MSRRPLIIAVCALVAAGVIVTAGVTQFAEPTAPATKAAPAPAVTRPRAPAPLAAPAPHGLPVIDYWSPPRGFSDDPRPQSTTGITEGLQPTTALVLYDAPGGKPKARLRPSISGLPVTVPIVARRTGWFAVLVPSVNRKIGWLPEGGWTPLPLHDHLVVQRGAHQLTWLRDGVAKGSWQVATGTSRTPTPLGRTFVLGRTATRGAVYAGLDALALGSVPDDPGVMSASLSQAHTGFHAWSNRSVFGRSISNGCIRLPRAAQRVLLANIAPGTPVTVLD